MSQIEIVTAQNVTLRIELANIGDRFLAAIIDFWVKIGLTFTISIVGNLLHLGVLVSCLLVLVWTCYFLIFELALRGQSPGKQAMKIRVARLDGAELTFGNILARWFFRIIDFPLSYIPTIGISAIVLTEKNQRLGDMVAGTVVVSTKERTSLAETFYEAIETDYRLAFPQVERLTERDAETIREVFYLLGKKDTNNLLHYTAEKLKTVLGIRTELDDFNFLKTVLKDYNYANIEGKTDNNERFAFSL